MVRQDFSLFFRHARGFGSDKFLQPLTRGERNNMWEKELESNLGSLEPEMTDSNPYKTAISELIPTIVKSSLEPGTNLLYS